MAAETSWSRYGTKLRHCHRMYIVTVEGLTMILMTTGTAPVRMLLSRRIVTNCFPKRLKNLSLIYLFTDLSSNSFPSVTLNFER